MSGTYSEVYYHVIWRTRQNEPYITTELEPHLYAYLRSRCAALGVFVHALGGIEDHIHLACSVPPSMSVSEAVKQLKGSSAHFVNHQPELDSRLYWQDGYGVLTFARRDLPRVVAYVQNQRRHHQEGTLSGKMERDEEHS